MLSLLAWYLTGHLTFRLFLRRPPSLGAALAFGMGLGSVLRLATAAGMAYGMHLTLLLMLTAGLAVAVLVRPRAQKRELYRLSSSRNGLPDMAVSASLVLATGAGILVLVRFMGVPPASFDVLSYHLPQAAAMLTPETAQAILWNPETFYARMPLGAAVIEEPFVDPAVGGIHGLALSTFLVFCVLATAASAMRVVAWLGGRTHARLGAAALVILNPMVSDAVLRLLQEPIMGLFSMAALELILQGVARNGGGARALFAAGVSAGGAVAVKLSAVGVVAIPLTLLAAYWVIRIGRRPSFVAQCAAAWAIGGLLVTGPWLLRGLIIGGHPLHPFGGFSEAWTAEQARFVVEVHGPQSITTTGYWRDAVGKMAHLGFNFGGVSLAILGVMAGFATARGRRVLPVAAAVLIGYLTYLTVRHNPDRFLYAGAVLLLPAAVYAVSTLRRPLAFPSSPLVVLIALCLLSASSQLRLAASFEPVYTVTARKEVMKQYVGMDLPALAEMACDLAGDGRLLLIFEARPSLFRCTVEARTVWDQASYAGALKAAVDEKDFARRLYERGIRAIMVNEPEWGRYIDFYAADKMERGPRRFARITISGPIASEERVQALLHYPPHALAGLDRQQIEVLEAFLRDMRRSTIVAYPAGQSEIWAARLPPPVREKE